MLNTELANMKKKQQAAAEPHITAYRMGFAHYTTLPFQPHPCLRALKTSRTLHLSGRLKRKTYRF